MNSFIVPRSLPACSELPLPILMGSDLVTFCLVWRQSEPGNFAIVAEHLTGMEPLAAFGASIDSIPVRNPVFLITPIVSACCFGFHVRPSLLFVPLPNRQNTIYLSALSLWAISA